MRQKNEERKKA